MFVSFRFVLKKQSVEIMRTDLEIRNRISCFMWDFWNYFKKKDFFFLKFKPLIMYC